MADGFTFNSLIESLSAMGSASSNLADLSATGKGARVRPLVDYNDFSQHIFFGNAIRRFDISRKEIIHKYPIGLSGLSADNVLQNGVVGPKAIFEVDKFRKEQDGFTLFILDRLGITGSLSTNYDGVAYNNTVMAKNERGENVPLIAVYRNSLNSITGSQTGIVASISSRAYLYEEEQLNVIQTTPGSATQIIGTSTGVSRHFAEFGTTATESITRSEKLKNLLPAVLFDGDDTDVLERLLAAFGDELDEIKTFANQIPYSKVIDYGDINRTPNKFIPTFLRQFGVNVFENARRTSVEKTLINTSASGYTAQKINHELWNRILNNVMHIIKTKGTREALEAIGRIYGVDHNFLKTNEYSVFYRPTLIHEAEEVDTPALYSTGDVFVMTTADAATGSARVFDFPASANFTLEMRVSTTGSAMQGYTGHTLFVHPLYTVELNGSGQVAFKSTVTASMSAETSLNSMSGFIHGAGSANSFLNVAVSRSGNTFNVYAMALSSSPTGGNRIISLNSGSTSNDGAAAGGGNAVSMVNLDSSGGAGSPLAIGGSVYSQFPSYFPGSGDTRFNGYIHQIRSWDVALKEDDLREHALNFESVSINGSTATDMINQVDNKASFGSLSAHYKLKENRVLQGDYNFIVDSTTAGNSAHPINFNTIATKRYRVFQNMEKINNYYPVGFSPNNDRIRQDNPGVGIQDTGYISFSMNPVNAVNRAIKNYVSHIAPAELLGNAQDVFAKKYGGEFEKQWQDITAQWGLGKEASLCADASSDIAPTNRVIRSGGSMPGSGVSGVSGSTVGLVDFNTFIKAMGNFNDTFGGLFPFIQQFLPAKTSIIGQGVFIENPMFERPKMRRQFGFRESTGTGYVGAPTNSGDRGHISYDEGREPYNQTPSIIDLSVTALAINNHFLQGDLSVQGAGSANDTTLMASAATTASFQGFQYTGGTQQFFKDSVTSIRVLPNVTTNSSVNVPRFSPTRVGRFLPVKVVPAAPQRSIVDVTLDKLLISPTAGPISTNVQSVINGTVKLLTNGKPFATDQPAFRFEFPTSGDGTNLFDAIVGDISRGQGREVKGKDASIITTLETENVEFELRLSEVVRSLTSENAVGQELVNRTASGSLGVVPIRVVNLFNNIPETFRVAINSDETKDQDFIRQIAEQNALDQ